MLPDSCRRRMILLLYPMPTGGDPEPVMMGGGGLLRSILMEVQHIYTYRDNFRS